MFGVVAEVSVLTAKNTCVVLGCLLGTIDSGIRIVDLAKKVYKKQHVHSGDIFQVMLSIAANIGKIACIIIVGPQVTAGFMALSIGTGIFVIAKLLVDNHVKIRNAEAKQKEIEHLTKKIQEKNDALRGINAKTEKNLYVKEIQERDKYSGELLKVQNYIEWTTTESLSNDSKRNGCLLGTIRAKGCYHHYCSASWHHGNDTLSLFLYPC